MADNNVIDSLELKVRSDANTAIANLGKLQNQLRHTAKSIGSVQSAVNSLNRVDMTFKRLGQINVGNLGAAITQLERLSKIDLSGVAGKKINLEVSITGASETTRQIEAMKKAANSLNPRQLSGKIVKAFNIEDKDSIRTIREQYRNIIESLRTTGKKDMDAENTIFDTIVKSGEVAKIKLSDQMSGMEDRYREFLKYISAKPFFNSEDFGAYFGETKGEINQTLFQNGLRNLFTSNANAVRNLNGLWEELLDSTHGYGDVLQGALGKEDYFNALGVQLGENIEQAELLAKAVLNVREALSKVQLSDISEEARINATMPFYENQVNIKKTFEKNVAKNMSESIGKIPLDIALDESSLTAQIQKMIENASKKQYDFPIKVKVEQSDLRQQFTQIIKGLDVSGLGTIAENLKETSKAITEMGSANLKESGLNSFVGSLRKLAETDTSRFNSEAITNTLGAIREMKDVGDISSSINRLVTALAKLASAGFKTKAAASALPSLGTAISRVAVGLSSSGGLPSEMLAFVSGLGQLANAGAKTMDTAINLKALGDSLKAFIQDMQSVPDVSENVIRMTEALAQLAANGGKVGAAARNVNKSLEKTGDGSQVAYTRLSAIVSIMRDLLSVFEKAGGVIKRGALKIVSALRNLKRESNGLQTATQSIRNMIGAMIGFRGITGLGNTIKETVMLGADITEIDHIVESVFGNMSGVVDKWAKDAIENFGIAEHSAKQYAGVLSSMFQASNIGYMDAGKMSLDLVGLAGDLSAFYNIDTETAFNKIRSGMAGMVRPLRDLGIDLTAATLEEYRLAQGIQTSYSQMSQAEKVMLRYNYLMSVTTTQQGDFGFGMVA